MNPPEKRDNTGVVAGMVLLFGGTLALFTGDASWRGHHVEGPLATVVGVSFLLFGAAFVALHIRNRTRNR
jgi:hypothetical protein